MNFQISVVCDLFKTDYDTKFGMRGFRSIVNLGVLVGKIYS
jgi:hypothetical protein